VGKKKGRNFWEGAFRRTIKNSQDAVAARKDRKKKFGRRNVFSRWAKNPQARRDVGEGVKGRYSLLYSKGGLSGRETKRERGEEANGRPTGEQALVYQEVGEISAIMFRRRREEKKRRMSSY